MRKGRASELGPPVFILRDTATQQSEPPQSATRAACSSWSRRPAGPTAKAMSTIARTAARGAEAREPIHGRNSVLHSQHATVVFCSGASQLCVDPKLPAYDRVYLSDGHRTIPPAPRTVPVESPVAHRRGAFSWPRCTDMLSRAVPPNQRNSLILLVKPLTSTRDWCTLVDTIGVRVDEM